MKNEMRQSEEMGKVEFRKVGDGLNLEKKRNESNWEKNGKTILKKGRGIKQSRPLGYTSTIMIEILP